MAAAVLKPRMPEPYIPGWLHRLVRANARAALVSAWLRWAPPPRMTTRDWADAYLYLSADSGSARPGKYNSDVTPWLQAMQEAVDDPLVRKVVCMKSSQIGWTVGVVIAYIGKRIDIDPCAIVVMFPTMDASKEFNAEKLVPTVEVTPSLRDKLDVSTSRKSGNRITFKKFPGGFLKFVGSNSPRSVKSTSAPVLIVEEPDDANRDVKGQGDSIALLEDRAKTHSRYKIIYGGTPTIKGLSAVEWAYLNSDQRKLFVPCHHCGEEHVLDWEHVRWVEDPQQTHEVYGHAKPETAYYACPHCGGTWNDYEKNQNVRHATWRATAPFAGVAGFGHISELYAHWPNSSLAALAAKHLQAQHKAAQGDMGELIRFYNSVLGVPFEYGKGGLDAEQLAARGEDYPELVVPMGGLLLTAGVDVQHDRFAIILRAWGRGDESWLVYWGEIYGTVNDRTNPVWQELEQRLFGAVQHACGRELFVEALTIDSSDGGTNDNVYDWVRAISRKYRHVKIMAGKGASEGGAEREIFSLPKQSIDHRTATKAARYGLRPYIIGTHKAKDLLLGGADGAGRVRLTGHGPGRFHVYKTVRADYWDQLTSEVKAPSRRLRGKLVWQQKAGKHNEALDCEIYALHAARSLKTHILTPAQWDEIERRLLQQDLFNQGAPAAEKEFPEKQPPAPPPTPARRNSDGFGSEEWNL